MSFFLGKLGLRLEAVGALSALGNSVFRSEQSHPFLAEAKAFASSSITTRTNGSPVTPHGKAQEGNELPNTYGIPSYHTHTLLLRTVIMI